MIIALSRFRVKNGKEDEVRDAFVHRPRAVERASGFQGLEVFRDSADPAVFLLLTRWDDEASFAAWHAQERGAAHRLMPAGLKLDPSETSLITAQRVQGATSGAAAGEQLLDLALPLAPALADSESLHVLEVGADRVVTRASRAFDVALGGSAVGRSVDALLSAGSREVLHVALGEDTDVVTLHFHDAEGNPFSLRCHVSRRGHGMVVVGEPPWRDHRALEAQLHAVNASLTVLTRENARKARELAEANDRLARAYEKLRDAHWHLQKISDVLPMCVDCRRVRTGAGDDSWEAVESYLERSSTFLSHGYCSQCAERLAAGSEGNG